MKYIRIVSTTLLLIFMSVPTSSFAQVLQTDAITNALKEAGIVTNLQSVCFGNDSGVLFSHRGVEPVVPASVSKLYVFDWALSVLPKDMTYQTKISRYGTTLYIQGGKDIYFTKAILESIIARTKLDTRYSIKKVYFDANFFINSTGDPLTVHKELKSIFGTAVPIYYKTVVSPVSASRQYVYTSAPLYKLLKPISSYSDNFGTQVLFSQLGGKEAFQQYMKNTYGIKEGEISFDTGSGLYGNITTCELTLKVVKHARETMDRLGIPEESILNIPGKDDGTSENRFEEYPLLRESLLMKSGHLHLHNTIAGTINTKDGPLYFAMFTFFPNPADDLKMKKYIDRVVSYTTSSYELIPYKAIPFVGKEFIGSTVKVK